MGTEYTKVRVIPEWNLEQVTFKSIGLSYLRERVTRVPACWNCKRLATQSEWNYCDVCKHFVCQECHTTDPDGRHPVCHECVYED